MSCCSTKTPLVLSLKKTFFMMIFNHSKLKSSRQHQIDTKFASSCQTSQLFTTPLCPISLAWTAAATISTKAATTIWKRSNRNKYACLNSRTKSRMEGNKDRGGRELRRYRTTAEDSKCRYGGKMIVIKVVGSFGEWLNASDYSIYTSSAGALRVARVSFWARCKHGYACTYGSFSVPNCTCV